MPSSRCEGYKKSLCWNPRQAALPRAADDSSQAHNLQNPRQATGIYCDTCQITSDRDELQSLSKVIASAPWPLEQILLAVNQPSIVRALLKGNLHASLDTLLAAIYANPSRHSRATLKAYVEKLRDTPLRASLLLRVRNHCRTPLCAPFGWMLRNGCFEDSFLPQKCLKCVTHMIRYGCNERPDRIRLLSTFFGTLLPQSQDPFMDLLRATLTTMTDGIERALDFIYALRDSPHAQFSLLAPTVENLFFGLLNRPGFGFTRAQINHATLLLHHHSAYIRAHMMLPVGNLLQIPAAQYITSRLEPYREELTAKTWHPSRFQHWCWSEDEKAELPDIEPAPPIVIPGRRALWDILW